MTVTGASGSPRKKAPSGVCPLITCGRSGSLVGVGSGLDAVGTGEDSASTAGSSVGWRVGGTAVGDGDGNAVARAVAVDGGSFPSSVDKAGAAASFSGPFGADEQAARMKIRMVSDKLSDFTRAIITSGTNSHVTALTMDS